MKLEKGKPPFVRPTVEEAIVRCNCHCHIIGGGNWTHCVPCCPIKNEKYMDEEGKLDEERYKKILKMYRDETKVYKWPGE